MKETKIWFSPYLRPSIVIICICLFGGKAIAEDAPLATVAASAGVPAVNDGAACVLNAVTAVIEKHEPVAPAPAVEDVKATYDEATTARLARSEQLKTIGAGLKRKFFGRDDEVDQIVSYVQLCEFHPERVTAPLKIISYEIPGQGKSTFQDAVVRAFGLDDRVYAPPLKPGTAARPYDGLVILANRSVNPRGVVGVLRLEEVQRVAPFAEMKEWEAERDALKAMPNEANTVTLTDAYTKTADYNERNRLVIAAQAKDAEKLKRIQELEQKINYRKISDDFYWDYYGNGIVNIPPPAETMTNLLNAVETSVKMINDSSRAIAEKTKTLSGFDADFQSKIVMKDGKALFAGLEVPNYDPLNPATWPVAVTAQKQQLKTEIETLEKQIRNLKRENLNDATEKLLANYGTSMGADGRLSPTDFMDKALSDFGELQFRIKQASKNATQTRTADLRRTIVFENANPPWLEDLLQKLDGTSLNHAQFRQAVADIPSSAKLTWFERHWGPNQGWRTRAGFGQILDAKLPDGAPEAEARVNHEISKVLEIANENLAEAKQTPVSFTATAATKSLIAGLYRPSATREFYASADSMLSGPANDVSIELLTTPVAKRPKTLTFDYDPASQFMVFKSTDPERPFEKKFKISVRNDLAGTVKPEAPASLAAIVNSSVRSGEVVVGMALTGSAPLEAKTAVAVGENYAARMWPAPDYQHIDYPRMAATIKLGGVNAQLNLVPHASIGEATIANIKGAQQELSNVATDLQKRRTELKPLFEGVDPLPAVSKVVDTTGNRQVFQLIADGKDQQAFIVTNLVARQILDNNQPLVKKIAAALNEKGSLTPEALQQIIREDIAERPAKPGEYDFRPSVLRSKPGSTNLDMAPEFRPKEPIVNIDMGEPKTTPAASKNFFTRWFSWALRKGKAAGIPQATAPRSLASLDGTAALHPTLQAWPSADKFKWTPIRSTVDSPLAAQLDVMGGIGKLSLQTTENLKSGSLHLTLQNTASTDAKKNATQMKKLLANLQKAASNAHYKTGGFAFDGEGKIQLDLDPSHPEQRAFLDQIVSRFQP